MANQSNAKAGNSTWGIMSTEILWT